MKLAPLLPILCIIQGLLLMAALGNIHGLREQHIQNSCLLSSILYLADSKSMLEYEDKLQAVKKICKLQDIEEPSKTAPYNTKI